MQTCQQRFDRWQLHIAYVCALFSRHPPAEVMSPGCSEGATHFLSVTLHAPTFLKYFAGIKLKTLNINKMSRNRNQRSYV